MSRLRSAAAWLVLAAGVTVFLDVSFFHEWSTDGGDLLSLYEAAEVVSEGRSAALYEHHPVHFNQGLPPSMRRPYMHTPLEAFLVRAALPLGFHLLLLLHAAACLGALAGACWLIGRRLGLPVADPLFAGALLLWLSAFEPLRYSVALGQTTPWIFALMTVALLARGDRKAGVALGLISAIKLTPAVLFVLFVAQRRWRALAWGGAVMLLVMGGSVAALGAEVFGHYVDNVRRVAGVGLAAFNNQSVTAFALRAGRPPDAAFSWRMYPLAAGFRIANLAMLALAALVVPLAWPRLGSGSRAWLSASWLVLLLLVMPGISWSHYYVYALLPLAALARLSWRRPEALLLLGLAAALMTRPLAMAELPPRPTANLFVSNYLLAALLLLALTARQAWCDRVRPPSAVRPAAAEPPAATAP